MPVVIQPKAYIGSVHELLYEYAKLNDGTVEFLQGFFNEFVELIKKY